MPDAVECLAAADVMISSEDSFSEAAAAMAANVKVVTDHWEVDEDEEMVSLSPAATVAGVSGDARAELNRIVRDWHHCNSTTSALA